MTYTKTSANRFAVASIAGLVALAASNVHAAKAQSTLIDETQHWQIVKSASNGEVQQCAARRKQPGPNKLIIVRRDIGWMVQVFNPAWPDNAYRKTSARLKVQGRTLALAGKYAVDTSFIFHLGDADDAIAPVARAKWLTFLPERGGKIGYTLRGVREAVNLLAGCYDASISSPRAPLAEAPAASDGEGPRGGAFGDPAPRSNAPQGAFGAPTTSSEPRPTKPDPAEVEPSLLNKTATLAFAKSYLKDANGYVFLPDNQGPTGWPVKWKLKSGVMGALAVMDNDPIATRDLLAERLKLEKAACKGRFQSRTNLKASVSTDPAQTAIGLYECTGKTAKQVGSYTIRKVSPSRMIMILELVDVPLPKFKGPKRIGA